MEFITESYRIRITEVDAHSKLTIPALNGLLQEMAWRHSVVAKVSVHDLSAQHNISWVLSRLKIWIDRLPNYDETVTVKTYVQEIDKYFYHRDFKVFDQEGNEIIRANSVWGLMDIVRRRITSVPDWMRAITPTDTNEKYVEKVSGKILGISNVETERRFDIRWHDIDSNQHVNNTKYVEWLLESIPTDILNNGTLRSIDMIFKNESVFGDKITTQSQAIENGFIHRILNQNGQELVTGETIW
ncbi:acyl-ACP thioesterase [Arcicella aurantiaca]|uniref:Acyl-ACP thioesterase n=1 Tax=Arcicella aurantiaca TaxID=591202 RepID=A0A316EI34_9BACT|nr:acyl-ACP thioesterase domain-containing protein [Arcicella aurantiaca]PWK28498.1 acyl-ACP thioesterase [Arcicella aurantiaca]